jgi:hypothetical protein
MSSVANPDSLDINAFGTCVENLAGDKQELFRKVQAGVGIDELEILTALLCE